MERWINVRTENVLLNENVLSMSIMLNKEEMCRTNQWICYVLQPSFCIYILWSACKIHGLRELSKHYHLWLDTKLGHGKCETRIVSCLCVACTNMSVNPWDSGVYHTKQLRYQPVVDFIYWPMLGSFNNWNIIHFTNKRHAVRTLIRCIRLCLMASVPIWNNYYI